MAGDADSQPLVARVFAELATHGFRSGEELAERLGVTRAAVWKAAAALRSLGVTVHAVRNRGYRLPDVCEGLDAQRIRRALSARAGAHVRHIEAVWSLPSTNATLLERSDLASGRADVLLAEYQSAGRGRRGRTWLAPPGGAICLSLGWSFSQLPRDLSALGLAVGVCARRALQARAEQQIRLKWPNDLVIDDRKLAGILIEMRAEMAGPTQVIIGIGVNASLGAELRQQIAATGTQPVDLRSAGVDPTPRNAIVADLVSEIVSGLQDFEREGLRPFVAEWVAADALHNRSVNVQSGDRSTRGVARGIDASGCLLLQTPNGLERVLSGDVSVRAE
jgi:BirA family biotin operon repressor/biotin-[acetyl-CoA-carboxylase] ligase